jgi:putative salt-induced outer membrane protein
VLHKVQFFALFVCVSSSLMFADQITLKNGDRLTGTVVKSDGKTVVLHTEAAGDVTVQFAAIQDIKTDTQLHVGLSNGKTVVGAISTSDGQLEIATKTAGTVETPKENVTVIRNDADQLAYEKSLHPGLMQNWAGGANIGFSLTRGNSETENLSLAFTATRTTLHDKFGVYANSVYATSPQSTPSTTANTQAGGLRYDRNLNPKLFAFVGGDFSSNALQFLDLRGVYGGGFGFHAVKSDKTTLDFLGGLNYTHETYSNGPPVVPATDPVTFVSYGVTNKFVALTLGQELMHKIGKGTGLTESLYFYPDLQDTSDYRATFNLGTVTKISKWLGWQNAFGDIYVSNPPIGAKKNDIVLTTGLSFSFSH